MNELLIPVSDNEFNKNVSIKFNNILNGFNSFKNFTITAKNIEDGENKFIEFIKRIFKENNNEVYIDFYINKISIENKNKLFSLIPIEDKEIFQIYLNSKTDKDDGMYYKLCNETFIPFLVRLNTREIFFITFYFTNRPITIWGNYNLKFPCFINSEEDFEYYYNISNTYGFN